MIWILAGYMLLYVHRPFEIYPILGRLRIERAYMICAILYWAIAAKKNWTSNRLNLAFAGLGIVILASALASPYPFSSATNHTVEDWFKIAAFYVMVISTVREERDLKRVVIAFLVVMSIYMADSLREFYNGRHVYRMGISRMIGVDITNGDPNTFSATILYALPMMFPFWALRQKRWHTALLSMYAGLSLLCIFLTGSRTAFAGLCLLVMLLVFFSRQRYKMLLLVVLAAPIVWISLPMDLQRRFLTIVDESYGPASAQTSAEGRLGGFLDGIELWKSRPLLGVGPGSFGLATERGFQSHNVYGQVLGELGTCGLIVFLFIVGGVFFNAYRSRKIYRAAADPANKLLYQISMVVALAAVLMLFMGWGGHNLYRYTWLWYGAFQAIALRCLVDRQSQVATPLPEELPEAGVTNGFSGGF